MMPVHYFKCHTCDGLFVGGETTFPENMACPLGKCLIEEIDEDEARILADEIAEEKWNERE